MKTFSNLSITVLAACLLIGGAQAAEVIYKSKDARGNVTYSGTAPVSGDYKIVGKTKKSSRATSANQENAEQQLLDAAAKREQSNEAGDKNAEYQKQMQAYCKSLRERLQVIKSNPYVQVKNEKGETTMLGDSARKGEISSLQSKISKDCK